MKLGKNDVEEFLDIYGTTLYRIKIEGGWLVYYEGMHSKGGITFVPDKNHKWGKKQKQGEKQK